MIYLFDWNCYKNNPLKKKMYNSIWCTTTVLYDINIEGK